MPRYGIQISVFGDKVIDREILSRGARAVEMTPVYEEIGWDLAGIMREQFDTEGARSGHQWAPNEPSTDARKQALGQPLKVFQATTELRESFKLWDSNNIYEATPEGLRWGSASEHGIWHQPDEKDRKVMELTEADKVGIVERMHMYIVYGELR
jgi:hypothetical protein